MAIINKKSPVLYKSKSVWKSLFLFLCLFLIRVYTIFLGKNVSAISDNMGDLAVPVTLAGNNWTYLIKTSSYYGYGFKWVYFLFFKYTSNPYIINGCIFVLQILLQAIALTVFYAEVKKYFDFKKTDWFVLLGVLVALLRSSSSFNSEGNIFFLIFFLGALSIYLFEDRSIWKRIFWSVFYASLLIYMITIHERNVAVVMATCFMIVLDWIISRKCVVQPVAFFVPLLVLYQVEEKLKAKVSVRFWPEKFANGSLRNISVAVKNPLWFLESRENFSAFMSTLISNCYALLIRTYGLAIIPVMLFFFLLFLFIFKHKEFKEWYSKNRAAVFTMLIFTISTLIILVGVAQRWGKNTVVGKYKGLSYYRYYAVFIWPAVVIGIVLLRQLKLKERMALLISTIIIYGSSLIFFTIRVYPKLMETTVTFASRFCYGEVLFPSKTVSDDRSFLIWASIIITIILTSLCLTTEKTCQVFYVIALIMALTVYTNGFKFEYTGNTSTVDSVYNFVSDIETKTELPEEIYFLDSDNNKIYTLQFMLNRHHIIPEWPYYGSEVIFISDKSKQEMIDREYTEDTTLYYYDIDDVYTMYIFGETYINLFREIGLDIKMME